MYNHSNSFINISQLKLPSKNKLKLKLVNTKNKKYLELSFNNAQENLPPIL